MLHSAMLYIDIGNTNLKWWLVNNKITKRSGRIPSQPACTDELISDLMLGVMEVGVNVGCVYIASVKSAEFTHHLADRLFRELAIQVYAVNVVPVLAGLSIAYSEPKSLGVDRWLGMHAAHLASTGYAIYISAGSAITVDVVNTDGQHLGGYIAPGAGMQRAMLNTTDRSATKASCVSGGLAFGCSTQACVDGGVGAMLSGFIGQVITSVLLLPDANRLGVHFYVSGGDAALILSLLEGDARTAFSACSMQLHEAAVLDGLKYICPYRESLTLLAGVC